MGHGRPVSIHPASAVNEAAEERLPETRAGKTALVHTIVELHAALDRHLATGGADAWMDLQNLTVKQLKIMLILSQRETETVTRLADTVGVHVSTVTGILDRLVQQRLVRREEDPDDRRHVVSRLTDEGNEVLDRLYYSVGRADLVARLDTLDAVTLATLERGLRALVGAWA